MGRRPGAAALLARVGALAALAALAPLAPLARTAPAHAQAPAPPALLIVLDASGSMNGDDGTGRPKLVAAKEALTRVVDGLPEGAPVGLRVYGHRVPNTDKARGCADTELIAPVAPLDKAALKGAIGSFAAKGFTPIGASLQAAAADLPPEGERTVLLVSDGVDTCAPPEPCDVARELAGQGVGLKVEAVGFQVDREAAAQLRCIAEATGGTYRDAADAEALARESVAVSARAFRNYRVTGAEVRGGPDQARATLLGPGSYRDTIGPNQPLWYGTRIEEGQQLKVSATIIGDPQGRESAFATFRITVHDPTGHLDRDGDSPVGRAPRTVSVTTSEAGPREAGTYGLEVELVDEGAAFGTRTFPIELVVEILGTPATTSTTSAAGASGPGDGDDVATPAGGDGAGWSTAMLTAVYGACLVAGAVAGAAALPLVLRRRP